MRPLWLLAAAAVVGAAIRGIEAYGLWRGRQWAGMVHPHVDEHLPAGGASTSQSPADVDPGRSVCPECRHRRLHGLRLAAPHRRPRKAAGNPNLRRRNFASGRAARNRCHCAVDWFVMDLILQAKQQPRLGRSQAGPASGSLPPGGFSTRFCDDHNWCYRRIRARDACAPAIASAGRCPSSCCWVIQPSSRRTGS